MPRFFFRVRDGDGLSEDPEGSELPNLDAARAEALAAARQLVADRLRRGDLSGGQAFEICDDAGRLLATVSFGDAAKLP